MIFPKRSSGLFLTAAACAVGVFQSCTKNRVEDYRSVGASYYHYQKGNIRIYDLDSTGYKWGSSQPVVYHFQVKEIITDTFRDLEGDVAYRVEQWISRDSGRNFSFYAINTLKYDNSSLQRVEDNQRYVKMTAPVAEKRNWDGNLYNALGYQEYKYIGVKKSYVNKHFDFADCVFVSELADTTVFSIDTRASVYAKDFALVYRLNESVKYKDTGDPQGFRVEWNLREYWEK